MNNQKPQRPPQPPHIIQPKAPFAQAPYSQEAEEALLGSILVNPEMFPTVRTFLKAEDFYILRHTYIWEALERIDDRGDEIDYLTVQHEIKAHGHLATIGGPAYLTQLANNTPTSMHAEIYGHMVERFAIRRQLLQAADDIKALALDEQMELEKTTDEAELRLHKVTARKTQSRVHDIGTEHFEIMMENSQKEDGIFGIPTGITGIDRELDGFQKRLAYLIAGISSHAKTDSLLNFIVAALRRGQRVLFFSLEMSRERVANKMLSIMTSIPHQRIQKGKLTKQEWDRYQIAYEQLTSWKLVIYDAEDESKTGWQRILAISRATAYRMGVDMICIDHMMLTNSGGKYPEGTFDDKLYPMKNLRQLAKAFNVPVLALHQINKRKFSPGKNKRPNMQHLEYGGETDVDVVMIMYKDSKYNKKAHPYAYEAIIVKNRDNGEVTTIHLSHEGAIAKVTEPLKPLVIEEEVEDEDE
jgi:replicative DNA helicase